MEMDNHNENKGCTLVVLCFILIVLMTICSKMDGQTSSHKGIPEWIKVNTVYIGSIALDASGDALNDTGQKEWGHLCNAASVGLLLTSPFIIDYDKSKWGWYLTSYVFLRIALFDPIYNTTAGLPINYVGNTSYWDKGLQKLAPPENDVFGRGISFIVGFSIPINRIK